MALENKAQKAKREALEALPRIVAATQGSLGYTYCSMDIIDYLVKKELAECDPGNTNEAGAVACRATKTGIDMVNAQTAKGSEKEMSNEFVIEKGIEIPKLKRGGGAGNSKYPFDKMEVGDSFFVAKEAKTLGGTVSSANKRYAVEVEGETRVNRKGNAVPKTVQERKFEARVSEKDGVAGTRIFRTK